MRVVDFDAALLAAIADKLDELEARIKPIIACRPGIEPIGFKYSGNKLPVSEDAPSTDKEKRVPSVLGKKLPGFQAVDTARDEKRAPQKRVEQEIEDNWRPHEDIDSSDTPRDAPEGDDNHEIKEEGDGSAGDLLLLHWRDIDSVRLGCEDDGGGRKGRGHTTNSQRAADDQ